MYWFAGITWILSCVNDGWSGRPAPLRHQLLLLPATLAFVYSLSRLLQTQRAGGFREKSRASRALLSFVVICCLSEAVAVVGFLYEGRHFARFGYTLPYRGVWLLISVCLTSGVLAARRQSGTSTFLGVMLSYAAGVAVAVAYFPLNYLRSDMLPVIWWADERLAAHLNPYVTMHVGSRLYDFPYLPGMLLSYFPAVLMHVDLRIMNLVCNIALSLVVYCAADREYRNAAALLIGVFLLSPFLQYRHDLYLAPHWLTLVLAIALMRWRHFLWAAAVFGISMGIYQLSWVLFPFFILNGLRRRGWKEAMKLMAVSFAGMFVILGPFVASASHRIANNAVGQWSKLPHALADPINLSYWVTFIVRPDELKWVQLVVLTGVFAFCLVWGRCRSLTDTLRWMSVALAIFIALNVLVDGYFYLTLLLLLLLYTVLVTGIWPEPTQNLETDTPLIVGMASS